MLHACLLVDLDWECVWFLTSHAFQQRSTNFISHIIRQRREVFLSVESRCGLIAHLSLVWQRSRPVDGGTQQGSGMVHGIESEFHTQQMSSRLNWHHRCTRHSHWQTDGLNVCVIEREIIGHLWLFKYVFILGLLIWDRLLYESNSSRYDHWKFNKIMLFEMNKGPLTPGLITDYQRGGIIDVIMCVIL